MRKKQNRDKEPNEEDIINQTLSFFGINSEDELNNIIETTWSKTQCFKCGKVIDLTTCLWDDGLPFCYRGCNHANL